MNVNRRCQDFKRTFLRVFSEAIKKSLRGKSSGRGFLSFSKREGANEPQFASEGKSFVGFPRGSVDLPRKV